VPGRPLFLFVNAYWVLCSEDRGSEWICAMQRTAIPCFDPRDPSQRLDQPRTWKPSSNPVLMRATLALDLVPMESIDWYQVAKTADLCEREVAA
jgi:hypothetical protein